VGTTNSDPAASGHRCGEDAAEELLGRCLTTDPPWRLSRRSTSVVTSSTVACPPPSPHPPPFHPSPDAPPSPPVHLHFRVRHRLFVRRGRISASPNDRARWRLCSPSLILPLALAALPPSAPRRRQRTYGSWAS